MLDKYKNLKFAVIGCGNWGKNLIRVFHQLGTLYGVCDLLEEKAQLCAKEYNTQSLKLSTLLSDEAITGIIIATPSITHYEIAKMSLNAGKHVFIEKPLALHVAHVNLLQELAQYKKRVLMVGHLLHYHPAFSALKKLCQQGKLGNLQYLYSHRLNLGKFPTEKSVLYDFAPHDLSMILSLTNQMPLQIQAMGGHFFSHTHLDSVRIQLEFASQQAHIFVSWLHPFKEQKLIVVGDKKMAVFDDCQPWENKLMLYPYPHDWNDGLPRPCSSHFEKVAITPAEPLLNECRHFMDSILQNQAPLTDVQEAKKVIVLLEAALLSIHTHNWVDLTNNKNTTFESTTSQITEELNC